MDKKPRIKYPVIVEGKYDRQRIIDLFDVDCISTDGFGIFNSDETLATIKALAKKSQIIVLTDSDGAGSLIRKRISQSVAADRIINLYTPQIKGKEKRKSAPSKQGFLGVEGMSTDVIRGLLTRFCEDGEPIREEGITKLDLYLDGLSGGRNSQMARDALASELALPKGMSANALLTALRYISTKAEYRAAIERIEKSTVSE